MSESMQRRQIHPERNDRRIQAERYLETEDRGEHPQTSGPAEAAAMKGVEADSVTLLDPAAA